MFKPIMVYFHEHKYQLHDIILWFQQIAFFSTWIYNSYWRHTLHVYAYVSMLMLYKVYGNHNFHFTHIFVDLSPLCIDLILNYTIFFIWHVYMFKYTLYHRTSFSVETWTNFLIILLSFSSFFLIFGYVYGNEIFIITKSTKYLINCYYIIDCY